MPDTIEGELVEETAKVNSPRKKVDIAKLKKMKAKGMTNVECAKIFDVASQSIDKHVKRFEIIPDIEDYRSRKADILESKQAEVLLYGLDRDKIKGATAQQAAVILGILDDKIRLERGQATSILDVNIRALIASISPSTVTEMDTEG